MRIICRYLRVLDSELIDRAFKDLRFKCTPINDAAISSADFTYYIFSPINNNIQMLLFSYKRMIFYRVTVSFIVIVNTLFIWSSKHSFCNFIFIALFTTFFAAVFYDRITYPNSGFQFFFFFLLFFKSHNQSRQIVQQSCIMRSADYTVI